MPPGDATDALLPLRGKWLLYFYGLITLAAGSTLLCLVPLRTRTNPIGPVVVGNAHWLGVLLLARGFLFWRDGWNPNPKKEQAPVKNASPQIASNRVSRSRFLRLLLFGLLLSFSTVAGLLFAVRAAGEVQLDFCGHGILVWVTRSIDPTAAAGFPEISRANTFDLGPSSCRFWVRGY